MKLKFSLKYFILLTAVSKGTGQGEVINFPFCSTYFMLLLYMPQKLFKVLTGNVIEMSKVSAPMHCA